MGKPKWLTEERDENLWEQGFPGAAKYMGISFAKLVVFAFTGKDPEETDEERATRHWKSEPVQISCAREPLLHEVRPITHKVEPSGRTYKATLMVDSSEGSNVAIWLPLMQVMKAGGAHVCTFDTEVRPYDPEVPVVEGGKLNHEPVLDYMLSLGKMPRRVFVITTGAGRFPANLPGVRRFDWHWIFTKPYNKHELWDLGHFGMKHVMESIVQASANPEEYAAELMLL